jgi:hypothetical protein
MSKRTRVFELVYPAGEFAGLPSFIGWGVGAQPWLTRWELRQWDGSRLGGFFRQLDGCGLHPEASTRGLPSWPVGEKEAVKLVRWRVAMICRWAGQPRPPWLLNIHGRPSQPYYARRPVTRLSDGGPDHFPSVRSAARARSVDHAAIVWCLTTGCSDRQGGRWVESLDLSEGSV